MATSPEGLAWSRQVLGESGPYVRSAVMRVLAATHETYAAQHLRNDLGSADDYGLMWLAVPRALVQELAGIAGVQVHRPKGTRYRVPVVNGVPLVPWRYAKDRSTAITDVPFGSPVSEARRSLFGLEIQLELELGVTGLGDAVVAKLPAGEQQQLARYLQSIRELAQEGRRIAVLGYASTPDALLRAHLGYADLGAEDHLVWAFREELSVPAASGATTSTIRASALGDDAFDAGPVGKPVLRPRPARKIGTA